MEHLIYMFVSLLVMIVVYMAALVTYHTIRSDSFETQQKALIIALAWLIPIIGPGLIISVLSEDKPIIRKPGVPLIDFIFLSWAFTQDSSHSDGDPSSMHDVSGFGGGNDESS
ncbi:MAG: hypothetical protein CMF25_03505 [Kangiellaceae bacterium]|nr:hypothetical protein [Kangiellaceae bacterium]